jgi:hypothetical protein
VGPAANEWSDGKFYWTGKIEISRARTQPDKPYDEDRMNAHIPCSSK